MLCYSFAAGKSKLTLGNVTFKSLFADPDVIPTADFKTLIVPIKRVGNLIIVEATVDTLEGNFVLDTGAPYLILNETYFRNYPNMGNDEVVGATGVSSGSYATIVRDFSILDLKYNRLTAQVTNLSSIENGRHIKILGLLGTRLFSKFALTVDLFRNVLYIQKLGKDGNIPESELFYHNPFLISPFKYLDDIMFFKGSVNNNVFWFAFDTAAETNLLDYQKTKNIMSSMHVMGRSKLTCIGGFSFEVIYACFDQLTIGEQTFMKNQVLITSPEKIGECYGYRVDGVLGNDFF
jgi:hypothetical protein